MGKTRSTNYSRKNYNGLLKELQREKRMAEQILKEQLDEAEKEAQELETAQSGNVVAEVPALEDVQELQQELPEQIVQEEQEANEAPARIETQYIEQEDKICAASIQEPQKENNKQKNYYTQKVFRQRLLSDENIRFFFGSDGYIHDKTCLIAKQIPDDELQYSYEYRQDLKQCSYCRLKAYLRIGAKDRKKYNDYERVFDMMKIPASMLRDIYICEDMKTSISCDTITLWTKYDRWQIEALDKNGHVQLRHNNYIRKKNGERQFASGYHVQNNEMQRTSIRRAYCVLRDHNRLVEQEMKRLAADSDDSENIESVMPEEFSGTERPDTVEQNDNRATKDNEKERVGISIEESLKSRILTLLDKFRSRIKNYNRNWYHRSEVVLSKDSFIKKKSKKLPKNKKQYLYVWKGSDGRRYLQAGMYNAELEQFEVVYGEAKTIVKMDKVVSWAPFPHWD